MHFFHNLVHTVCHKTIFVSDSFAIIKGSAERHVKEGSQLSLFCAIEDSSGPPNYVFWYRDDHVVNYSDEMGIQILTDPDQIQVPTYLHICIYVIFQVTMNILGNFSPFSFFTKKRKKWKKFEKAFSNKMSFLTICQMST